MKCILSLKLYKIYFIAGNTWPNGNVKNCMLSSIFQRICNLLFHDWFSVFWQIESHFYKHCMVVGASIELVRYNVKNVISFSSLQKGEFSRLSTFCFVWIPVTHLKGQNMIKKRQKLLLSEVGFEPTPSFEDQNAHW